jgi:hypothetical protein
MDSETENAAFESTQWSAGSCARGGDVRGRQARVLVALELPHDVAGPQLRR